MKKNIVFLICILSIFALQSCKVSDETPKPKGKGDFYVRFLSASGRWKIDPPGSEPYLEEVETIVCKHGDVPGRISNAVFKIYADTTLLAEIDIFNFADFCLESGYMDLDIEADLFAQGKIFLPHGYFKGCVQKKWTAKPTKVEVIAYITDDNNYTHELHETKTFFIIGG
jgi:hypothetical protein